MRREGTGVNSFLQGMSSSEPKNSAIAQKRAEFEAQRKERADARELEREGHEEGCLAKILHI